MNLWVLDVRLGRKDLRTEAVYESKGLQSSSINRVGGRGVRVEDMLKGLAPKCLASSSELRRVRAGAREARRSLGGVHGHGERGHVQGPGDRAGRGRWPDNQASWRQKERGLVETLLNYVRSIVDHVYSTLFILR